MARTAVNPKVLNTPEPTGMDLTKIRAADSQTWKRGQLLYISSGTPAACSTTGRTTVAWMAAEDQATSTSSTDVWVYTLVPGMRMLIYVMNAGTAATAASAVVGTRYGIRDLSNVSYLDVATTSGQFEVIRAHSAANDLGDKWYDCDAAPGLVEVEFKFIS